MHCEALSAITFLHFANVCNDLTDLVLGETLLEVGVFRISFYLSIGTSANEISNDLV